MLSVLIVESPGLEDITSGDREGDILARQLQLIRIPCEYKSIHKADLLIEVIKEHNKYDVIHLSCHGNENALYFTDKSRLNWDELQKILLTFGSDRLVVLSACNSAFFKPDATLAEFLKRFTFNTLKPPKCIFTMSGNFYFADGVLAWGLFYRKFSEELKENKTSVLSCTSRMIYKSLSCVKKAELPEVKICAAYWYEQHNKYVNISPWLRGEKIINDIEKGLPVSDKSI